MKCCVSAKCYPWQWHGDQKIGLSDASSYSINYKLISLLKWRVTETFSFLANCLTLKIEWISANWLVETNVFSSLTLSDIQQLEMDWLQSRAKHCRWSPKQNRFAVGFSREVSKGPEQAVPAEASLPSWLTWVKPSNSCAMSLSAFPSRSALGAFVPGPSWELRVCDGDTAEPGVPPSPGSLCLSWDTFEAVPKAGHKWQCSQVLKVMLKIKSIASSTLPCSLSFSQNPNKPTQKVSPSSPGRGGSKEVL